MAYSNNAGGNDNFFWKGILKYLPRIAKKFHKTDTQFQEIYFTELVPKRAEVEKIK